MKKLFIGASIVAAALITVPANAASTLAVANGNSIGFVNTAAGALAVGNAAAASQQAGVNTSVGTGIAATTGHVLNIGNGNGIGFTNVTP